MKTDLIVLFSGGRTSAYMSLWIKRNWSHLYNLNFVYCNTGQEHEKTLEFVNICDKEMNLNLVWLEAKIMPKGKGTLYNIVDFESASREGKPFEDMVKKFGLPNKDFPHCTRELKIEPIKKWAKDHLSKDYKLALGIRADEPKRLRQTKTDNEKLFPLAHDHPMTKEGIIEWWANQHFDLQIPEHLGNCTWCWKKSDRKLYTLAHDHPEIFEFPAMLESKYANVSNYERKDTRVLFRHKRSTLDILEDAKSPFDKFIDKHHDYMELDECAEECGTFEPEPITGATK